MSILRFVKKIIAWRVSLFIARMKYAIFQSDLLKLNHKKSEYTNKHNHKPKAIKKNYRHIMKITNLFLLLLLTTIVASSHFTSGYTTTGSNLRGIDRGEAGEEEDYNIEKQMKPLPHCDATGTNIHSSKNASQPNLINGKGSYSW